jgi:alpha-L-rhamnosidase
MSRWAFAQETGAQEMINGRTFGEFAVRAQPLVVVFLMLLSMPVFSTGASAAETSTSAGAELRASMIWTAELPAPKAWLFAGFRRDFELDEIPAKAAFQIFAYTRYQLFVNGEYVGRGPNRYENKRPEYDEWDLQSRLRKGRNLIAVLVRRDYSPAISSDFSANGFSRIEYHEPGMTALLELGSADGQTTVIATDSQWRGFSEPAYQAPQGFHYSSIPEFIDFRRSRGEWTSPEFDAQALPRASRVDTSDAASWPVIHPRTIPLLRESEIPFTVEAKGPVDSRDNAFAMKEGSELVLHCPRVAQAYAVLEIDADEGAKIQTTGNNICICRRGTQRWIGGDTFAFRDFSIRVSEGRAKLRRPRIVEVLYPFDRVGKFTSSDPLLDRIWQVTAKSLELLSEDAFVDCADRERSEWMDCDPPMFDAARVMMAGPSADGGKTWSDPRLFKNMLRRVAMSQEANGMVRARTCSDLRDIHTLMEDRACDWVEGIRKYYDCTGDKDLVRELWPNLERLLDWILQRRTPNGLIRAREWIAWDNPVSYATCEGAANNAFFYRALADSAYLGGEIGKTDEARKLDLAAKDLAAAFDRLLWNEAAGAYGAAHGEPEVLPADRMFKERIDPKIADGRVEPTLHANLFALDRGIVPRDRRDRVVRWTLAHQDQITQIMAQHFYFKLLYGLDEEKYDAEVIDRIRKGWKGMAESSNQTTWELTAGGSQMHCYGIVPGHTLSTYVLGVRRDEPVWKNRLVIEPRLAGLTHAEGVVVSEYGPVPVSWTRSGETLDFTVEIPEGCTAELHLPVGPAGRAVLNEKDAPARRRGRWLVVTLPAGRYQGSSR